MYRHDAPVMRHPPLREIGREHQLIVGPRPWWSAPGGWLHGLAGLIASMEQEWSISMGRSYQDATEALVAEATLADGTPAVLKLLIPGPDNDARNEVTVLRLARGDGCVRLLRADPERGALLLEDGMREGLGAGRMAGPALRPGCHRHLAVGRGRTRLGRPAGHEDRAAAGGPGDAGRRRPDLRRVGGFFARPGVTGPCDWSAREPGPTAREAPDLAGRSHYLGDPAGQQDRRAERTVRGQRVIPGAA